MCGAGGTGTLIRRKGAGVLDTVSDDAAAAGAAFADIAGDVAVVGHSYGGVVITEARFDSRARMTAARTRVS